MDEPNWTMLVENKNFNAPTETLWVRIVDYVRGPRKLKIQVTGTWSYDSSTQCGPDGISTDGFADGNLHHTALKGCVIAKVGGCPGDTVTSDKLFAVGSFSIFNIGDAFGALFLSMNDAPANFHNHSGSLSVSIFEAS
jgi:hypothetical protein